MLKKLLIYTLLTGVLTAEVDIPSNKCALIITSSKYMYEIKDYLENKLDDKKYLNVYIANNQRYAVSRGFLTDNEVDAVMKNWKASGKIPQDSFCLKSHKFVRELLPYEYSSSNTSYSRTTSKKSYSRSSECKNIEQEKTNCYILSFGPKACSEAIFASDPQLRDSLGDRIAVSTACTYGVKNSLASQYVPDDFALTVLDEITEPSCKKLIRGEANFFEAIFAVGACVTVAGSTQLKYNMAKSCVRKIEQKCRE